jgi:hypothetical protein
MTTSPNTPEKTYAVLAFDDVAVDAFYNCSDAHITAKGGTKDENFAPETLEEVQSLLEGLEKLEIKSGGSARFNVERHLFDNGC